MESWLLLTPLALLLAALAFLMLLRAVWPTPQTPTLEDEPAAPERDEPTAARPQPLRPARSAPPPSPPTPPPSRWAGAPSPPAPRAPSSPSTPPRWVKPGEVVNVAGYTIAGGMLYVGSRLPALAAYRDVEPALIDPGLPARTGPNSRSGEGMGYWPSYSGISPEHRAGYLEWLATGRSDPDAYIGYVFLYFYGLERRALNADPADRADVEELAQLVAEVRRLQQIYGQNGSFGGYSASFLSICRIQAGDAVGALRATMFGWEIPPDVRLRLGRHASTKVPVPAELAFGWACNLPSAPRRTPATRCEPEFRELFELRYAEVYGQGVVLKNQGPKLKIDYRPASPGFGGSLTLKVPDVRDVSNANASVGEALAALASDCVDSLDAYSRWLGRNAQGDASALAGVALLPKELLHRHGAPALADLRQWLDRYVPAGEPVMAGAAEVLARWLPGGAAKVGKADATALVTFLEKLGIGIEPDVRFGGPAPSPQGQIALFRLEGGGAAPTAEYSGITTLMRFAAAVAGADGVAEAESRFLREHVAGALGLAAGERRRLEANAAWLLTEPPSPAALKKAAAALTAPQRADVGRFMVSVAGADGTVSRAEVQTLLKIFALLGLPEEAVYAQVHQLGGESMANTRATKEPVVVRQGAPTEAGFSIPTRPTSTSDAGALGRPEVGRIQLDMARVQAQVAESARASAVLADIFRGDEEQAPPPPPPPTGPSIAGLDSGHSAMLLALSGVASMERDEWARRCAELGLMPDGAIDTLNEAALDIVGDPLISGDDPLLIDTDVFGSIPQ